MSLSFFFDRLALTSLYATLPTPISCNTCGRTLSKNAKILITLFSVFCFERYIFLRRNVLLHILDYFIFEISSVRALLVICLMSFSCAPPYRRVTLYVWDSWIHVSICVKRAYTWHTAASLIAELLVYQIVNSQLDSKSTPTASLYPWLTSTRLIFLKYSTAKCQFWVISWAGKIIPSKLVSAPRKKTTKPSIAFY